MAGENPGYLAWLRSGPCSLSGKDPCSGPIQAHHSTHVKRGKGQRAHDRQSFPLCMWHHHTFHDCCGYFKTWRKSERQAWQDELVAQYWKAYSRPDVF